ncbi:MAG TPA: dTMP kinase [Fimbriiglobus sp.]|jgi:dTMP kinase
MIRSDPGTLIAFEGIDGAGKTTQQAFLADHLKAKGIPCVCSKEPTDGNWGRQIRRSAQDGRLSLPEELRILTEDRREHVRERIMPALISGQTVILDRYFYSTIAYQGSQGGDVSALANAMTTEFPIPDIVFLVDVPVEVGLARISQGRREVPNHFEKLESLAAAREIFLKTAAHHPNIVTVDGTKSVEEVRRNILQILDERWPFKL